MEYVNRREKLNIGNRKGWVGLSVLVGVDVLFR